MEALEFQKDNSNSMDAAAISEFLQRRYCNGVMGVPITFLDKYNPEQFDILDINPHFFTTIANGMAKPEQLHLHKCGRKDPYARILINKKAGA